MRTPPTTPPPFTPPSPFAPDVAGEWPTVHIEDVALSPAAPGTAHAAVRACVQLGRLLPVDVEASVEVEGEVPGDVATAPMWTAQSFHNGRYEFEAHLPQARLAGARCLSVTVRPHGSARRRFCLVTVLSSAELRRSLAPRGADAPGAPGR